MHLQHFKLIFLSLLILIFLFIFIVFKLDVESILFYLKDDSIDSSIILIAILFLPILFFPITPLLILIGIRFDTLYAISIVLIVIPAHLTFSFVIAKYFFQDILKRYAKHKMFYIFNIPNNRYTEFCFLFLSIPGLPYAIKNIVLPVSDIPFRNYFIVGWFIHSLMCIPFILLGDAALNLDLYFLFIPLFLFILIFYGIKFVRNKIDQNIKESGSL